VHLSPGVGGSAKVEVSKDPLGPAASSRRRNNSPVAHVPGRDALVSRLRRQRCPRAAEIHRAWRPGQRLSELGQRHSAAGVDPCVPVPIAISPAEGSARSLFQTSRTSAPDVNPLRSSIGISRVLFLPPPNRSATVTFKSLRRLHRDVSCRLTPTSSSAFTYTSVPVKRMRSTPPHPTPARVNRSIGRSRTISTACRCTDVRSANTSLSHPRLPTIALSPLWLRIQEACPTPTGKCSADGRAAIYLHSASRTQTPTPELPTFHSPTSKLVTTSPLLSHPTSHGVPSSTAKTPEQPRKLRAVYVPSPLEPLPIY